MGKKRRPVAPEAKKVKKTFCLDVQTARRLGSFAGHEGLHESDVVSAALLVHLRGFKSFRTDLPADEPAVRLADVDDQGTGKVRESA